MASHGVFLEPNFWVLGAGLGPVVTFAMTYTIAFSEGHLSWDNGVTLSQSIAYAPERFVGTFFLSLSCFCVFVVIFMRKMFCDMHLGTEASTRNKVLQTHILNYLDSS